MLGEMGDVFQKRPAVKPKPSLHQPQQGHAAVRTGMWFSVYATFPFRIPRGSGSAVHQAAVVLSLGFRFSGIQRFVTLFFPVPGGFAAVTGGGT